MPKEYLKPEDWYVCLETDHPLILKHTSCWHECWTIATFVPKEYFDQHGDIRDTATNKEFAMLDEELKRLGWLWVRKGRLNGFTHEQLNMYSPMTGCFFISKKENAPDYAADFIRIGFNYNRYLNKGQVGKGKVVEPNKLHGNQFAVWIRVWIGGHFKDMIDLLPEHLNKDELVNQLCNDSNWKREKKIDENTWLFKFAYDVNLKARVTISPDGFKIANCQLEYGDKQEPTYKIESDRDRQFINFIRNAFNRIPNKKDFEVVAAAANLMLTLPSSHGKTSIIKTLLGKAVATSKRTEFGIAKEYSPTMISKMVTNLENFLEDRHLLEYEDMPYNPNSDNNAPEFIRNRKVGELEVTMLSEYFKELAEKYGEK